MTQKKHSKSESTTKVESHSSTHKKAYPKPSGSGSGLFSKEKNRERLQERQLKDRCAELGYEQDPESRSYPCWCGKEKVNSVWLLSAGKSRGSHFFCLRCAERRPTEDFEEIARDYNKAVRPIKIAINNELAKLLKEK